MSEEFLFGNDTFLHAVGRSHRGEVGRTMNATARVRRAQPGAE